MNDAPGLQISADYARLLFDYLGALKIDAARLVAAQDLVRIESAMAQASVPRQSWLAMLAQVAEHQGDPDLALKVGEAFQVRHLGLPGYVLMSCSTMEEAGLRFARYARLVGDIGDSQVHRGAVDGEYVIVWPDRAKPPAAMEQLWAVATVSLTRWLTGRPDLRWDVHFQHPKPNDTMDYERIFQGPVRFDQPTTKLVFPAWVLDLPLLTSNSVMREAAEKQAAEILHGLADEPDVVRKTRTAIALNLGAGRASLDEVSKILGLSPRTLHRRLTEHGYNFREIADAERRSCAEALLRNAELTLSEVTFMLGYSDQSNFQHAFKRWTGRTPGEFRTEISRPRRTLDA